MLEDDSIDWLEVEDDVLDEVVLVAHVKGDNISNPSDFCFLLLPSL